MRASQHPLMQMDVVHVVLIGSAAQPAEWNLDHRATSADSQRFGAFRIARSESAAVTSIAGNVLKTITVQQLQATRVRHRH